MAAGFTPTFGPRRGQYCKAACRHTDCAAARLLVASPCVTCGKTISQQPRYFQAEGGDGYEHALCAYDRADARATVSG